MEPINDPSTTIEVQSLPTFSVGTFVERAGAELSGVVVESTPARIVIRLHGGPSTVEALAGQGHTFTAVPQGPAPLTMETARALAADWHEGQADPLYGFSSTGDLDSWGSDLIELDGTDQADEALALSALASFARSQVSHVVTLSMPGCLPESDPVYFWSLSSAVAYVVDEVDRMVDDYCTAAMNHGDYAEWSSALAHAESYRDGSGDLPCVELPDGYVITCNAVSGMVG